MNVVTQFPAARDYDRDLRFRAMFEGAAIGIGICQLDGRILEANPALSRMLGYNQEELTGTNARELYPERRREVGPEISDDNFPPDERLLADLLRGKRDSFEVEKRYRRKDGSELWGHLTVSLGRDDRREPAFLIAMLADATERKRVEEHLRQAEKMEVIGRLAGGIAHDFNNLLTGILLYCDLLTARLKSGAWESGELDESRLENGRSERSRLCQHVEEVRLAGEHGAALTHQLLAIARKQAAEPRPIPINEIVASMENLLRRLIGEQIELVVVLDSALDSALDPALDSGAGRVLADPAQLRQILLNLVLNARDAMPHGGKIRLTTRSAELPSDFPSKAEPLAARRAVSLIVKDTGCGMNAETRARLFEPFFTTKNPGEGTGLGLATVQRIVSEAGGMIEVESEPGRGTSIEVFFPAIDFSTEQFSTGILSQPTSAPVARPFSSKGGAGEIVPQSKHKTILLVDDHATARNSMQRVLVDAGYRILPASGAKQALSVFADHLGTVDLLLADCMMPGMKGQELAEILRSRKPDLKVLLISGYQHAPLESAAGAVKLIRKPFSGKVLIERVVDVMRSP